MRFDMAICFERLNNKVRKVSLTLYPQDKEKEAGGL
jgi:hypothetical protein